MASEERIMKKNKEIKNKEQGQSLVELSISLIVLLTLIAGLVDLGRAFFTYVTLRDAAQEGASYASVARDDGIADANDLVNFCQQISDRVAITTTDLSGNTAASTGPINLQGLTTSGDVVVETQINGVDCASISPANVCMGGAVSVEVIYGNFPITMPFMGTIIGSQTFPLRAKVVDTILTPPCQ
jgi:Flp pilus assembly protein TadG